MFQQMCQEILRIIGPRIVITVSHFVTHWLILVTVHTDMLP